MPTVLILFAVSAAIIVVAVYFEVRHLRNSESIAVVYNKNDTVCLAQVHTEYSSKVSLQLETESVSPLHILHVYSSPCDKLTSLDSIHVSSAKFLFDGTVEILHPTYFVRGSRIEVLTTILNVSVIDVDITLYIFDNLNVYAKFSSNLNKNVYKATIYTSGPGVQNTSTFVNYTVPSTGYYYAAIDADFYTFAQFDITLHKELYSVSGYKQSCVIQGNNHCLLSYEFSFQDKQECVLAHSDYPPDVQWLPANIQVTVDARRNTLSAIIAISVTAVTCFLIISFFAVCGLYCLCKSL